MALLVVSAGMLTPLYWVLRTSITGDNIFAYPPAIVPREVHLYYYVDVWYYVPFVRFLVNSALVSLIVVAGNLVFNAMAGYALTLHFRAKRAVVLLLLSCMMIPFQATIIPAYLITKELRLLNTHLGLALPLCSTIVCIFVFKAAFDAVPRSLLDAARLDGLGDLSILARIMLPLSTAAVATNVILAFIWSWNNFLWPLIVVRNQEMQTLPTGPVDLSQLPGEHHGGPLRLLHHGADPGRARVRAGSEAIRGGPDLGGHQGIARCGGFSSTATRWCSAPSP